MEKIWNVAIYTRVSTDKKEQSESIPAQVQSLKKWLLEKSGNDKQEIYKLQQIYKDQGFSGSNFERESFIKMKKDIENGKINMVLTRDLSRFARNYITAGYYLEDYFKNKGVRFVSVLDNVDTIDEVDDIVPFKNILNEMYIKDCSRRTRDGLKQRMIRGSSIASKPPYGYRFEENYDESIKSIKLVPREDETTKVVKKIFELYIQGFGMGRIATYLNDRGIAPPSALIKNFSRSKFKLWNNNTIRSILTNPKYAGVMVQGRWKKVSYKIKKIRPTSKDEWIIGGEFKGIVSKQIFEIVQELMKKRSKVFRHKGGNVHLFSGILKCNECGGSMSYRGDFKGYKCTNSQMGGGRCTAHSIKEEYLVKEIRENIKKYINKIDSTKKFYDLAKVKLEDNNNYKKKLKNIDKELKILDDKFQKIYSDNLNRTINERNFKNLISGIENQQQRLINRKKYIENLYLNNDYKEKIYYEYKTKVDKILNFEEVDRFIIENLIDKIVVSENKITKEKNIDIYYKFKEPISIMNPPQHV
ncbi:recombinase family protein [Clostridium botulinum]|uniref:Resolvase n=3 Tax=Clostridium botulinum TaxID=1491 RepID=A0A9Q1V0E4_CLOBO|nr:recombinase family protein [Clostridium botulinum]AEB76996.1 site-specific recombinase, resolvase family, putative [Clostridium botulinum BKT015925]KEH98428.1 resolvase [Clostridium botulinum D str. 16868]KEI04494.1 resolvase [Clostridium botulinum C/D str. Sp77]KLU75440.1 resolvase [Clostridium botulinum V891]KOA76296.1 resolvase [Clostridium botulinum]